MRTTITTKAKQPVKSKKQINKAEISPEEEIVYSTKEKNACKKALLSFGEKLISEWDEIKTPTNGVPRNPKCVWPKKVLIKFYYIKVLPEIDNFESSARGAQIRGSDKGDDGSNSGDELNSNVKATGNAETYARVSVEINTDLTKKRFLEHIKKQIEAGTFVCKCDVGTFYLHNMLV